MNDAKALALLKSGDQEALAWFIDKYSAYVGTVVNSILSGAMSHEDVEEVTADVFVTLWRSADNLIPLNLKGYLSRVARSLSMQKLRERFEVLPLDEDILILDEDSVFDILSDRFGYRQSNADEPVHGQDQVKARARAAPLLPQRFQKHKRRRS